MEPQTLIADGSRDRQGDPATPASATRARSWGSDGGVQASDRRLCIRCAQSLDRSPGHIDLLYGPLEIMQPSAVVTAQPLGTAGLARCLVQMLATR